MNQFEEAWLLWPRKVGKDKAFKKYQQALKKTTHENLVQCVTEFAEHSKHTERQFIPHMSTWLHNSMWDDDLTTDRDNIPRQSKTSTHLAAAYAIAQKKQAAMEQQDRGMGDALDVFLT